MSQPLLWPCHNSLEQLSGSEVERKQQTMECRIAFTPFRVDLQGLDGLWCQL
jgi:hypothetical protein